MLLYGAFAVHFLLAFWAIYERRTFRLPPAELLRIALGLWLPVLLMGHVIATRLEFELIGSDPTYARIVAGLWSSNAEWRQIGLLAPGWLHGCLGLYYAFGHRPLWRRLQFVLFAIALLLPVLSALGFVTMGRDIARKLTARGCRDLDSAPVDAETQAKRATMRRWLDGLLLVYVGLIGATFAARGVRNMVERRRRGLVTISLSEPYRSCAARMVGAGGEPRFPYRARIELRRAGEMLDLPGARDQRRRFLS